MPHVDGALRIGHFDFLGVEPVLDPAAKFAGHIPLGARDGPEQRPDHHTVLPEVFDPEHIGIAGEARGPGRIVPELAELVPETVEVLSGAGVTFELIIVDDGSTDGTATLMRGLRSLSSHSSRSRTRGSELTSRKSSRNAIA